MAITQEERLQKLESKIAEVVTENAKLTKDVNTLKTLKKASYINLGWDKELKFWMPGVSHAIILMNQTDICICYRYSTGFTAFKLNGTSINATCDNDGNVTVKKSDGNAFTVTVFYIG